MLIRALPELQTYFPATRLEFRDEALDINIF
jgi:hypothetical protein